MPVPAPVSQPEDFEDELFAPLDTRTGPDHIANQLPGIAEEEGVSLEPSGAEPELTPAPANQPEIFTYSDGSTLTIENVPTGFKAVLNSGKGNPEVFHGATKDEMWIKIAEAKVHATKKIRELNQSIKLGASQPTEPPTPATQISSNQLTADDMVDIQTKLASNPSLAFETWFQKRTGLTVDQLVKVAQDGQYAKQELETVAAAEQFVEDNPDYFVSPNNYRSILAYIYRNKLKRQISSLDSVDSITEAIYSAGAYTTANLTEAFEELKESGLLEFAPTPDAVPAEPPTVTAPPPQSGRIVQTTRRPRAGMGLRAGDTIAGPEPTPPSVDDLDNLSDKEVSELFAGTRRQRMQGRR